MPRLEVKSQAVPLFGASMLMVAVFAPV